MSKEHTIIIYHGSLEVLNSRFPLSELRRSVSIDLERKNYAGLIDARTFYAGEVEFPISKSRVGKAVPTFCIEGTPIVRAE